MKKPFVLRVGAVAPAVAGAKSSVPPAAIKLGIDVHASVHVVVAQYDHAAPRPPRRFAPDGVLPWVGSLLAAGHSVHAVYEACGFGFGLCRALRAAGAACHVIAPRALDERRCGVKTDARDAGALCQRLGRYVDGNTWELATIRVPSEAEEIARHVHRQREALVRARTKMQAQGRCLPVEHGLPAPPHWWRVRTWARIEGSAPGWALGRLGVLRPVLVALDAQIAGLGAELEAAAPPDLPRGLGKLTSVVLGREICDWHRFTNRRQVASYTGLCPGEHSSGDKRVQGSVTKHGNPRLRAALVELAWRLVRFQPNYPPVKARLAILSKGSPATGAQRKKALMSPPLHPSGCTSCSLQDRGQEKIFAS